MSMTPPHNCNFMNPKRPMEFEKSSFIKRLNEDINNLVICSTIFKRDNILINQLSQIVIMELKMLHLTMGNMVINKLNGTLIFTIDCSRGLNRKYKFTKKLATLDYLCTCMNVALICFFYSQQGDYRLFLA